MPKQSDAQPSLKKLYERALSLREQGAPITPGFLSLQLGIPTIRTSCLLYMLNREEYCPELEEISKRDNFLGLTDLNESATTLIEFLEDMPPYSRGLIHWDIPEASKKVYVKLGVARWASFEDFRQSHLHLYVILSRVIAEHHKLARAAIANNDRDFFLDYFKEKAGDPAFIVDNLQRELDPHEIDAVLTLLGLDRPEA